MLSRDLTRIRRVGVILCAAFMATTHAVASPAGEALEPRWKVVTPEGYDASRSYPLYIVLHGANSYLEDVLSVFKLDRYKGDYLLAFIESTEKAQHAGFTWYREIDKGRDEIRQCYEKITEAYPVDAERVIIGGFSAGGTMAIDVVLNEVIPTVGFVGSCPGKPSSFSKEKVRAAAGRGVRGVMIAGQDDYYGERQLDMAALFDEVGFEYRHILIAGLGHDYPDDLPERLDRGMEFVDPILRRKVDHTD